MGINKNIMRNKSKNTKRKIKKKTNKKQNIKSEVKNESTKNILMKGTGKNGKNSNKWKNRRTNKKVQIISNTNNIDDNHEEPEAESINENLSNDSDDDILKEVVVFEDKTPNSKIVINNLKNNRNTDDDTEEHIDNLSETGLINDSDLNHDDEEILKEVFAFDDDEINDNSDNTKKPKKVKKKITTNREKKLMKLVFGDKDNLVKNLNQTDKEKKLKKKKRVAAWHDSDDETITVENVTQFRKQDSLYSTKSSDIYKSLLEKNLKRIVGTPAWADFNKKTINDYNSDDDILQTIGHLAKQKSKKLQKTILNYKKLTNLNRTTLNEGPIITSIEFHPKSTVAIVTGKAGTATLFSVDGYKNEKIHSMLLKNFLIQTCRFNPNCNEIIFGGNKNFIYTYDMLVGTSLTIKLPKVMTNMSKFKISPNGKYIAVIGKYGELFLLNEKTKELITTLKQEYQSTDVTFSNDSTKILSHSDNNEISIFDIRTNRIAHRFSDDGCLTGSTIETSPNGNLLACGSREGVVNCYNFNDIYLSKYPKPLKSLFNITTEITCIKFNPTSEILAYCSNLIDDLLKMVHFPSATVYCNVPEFQSGLGKPNVLSFSPGGKYFAVGNMYKNVSLYSLGHFPNY